MMAPDEFLVEEYKQVQAEMFNRHGQYARLETITIGGVLASYGFLFLHPEIHVVAWLAVPLFVGIGAVRSFGYYILINWNLSRYLRRIEREIYGTRFDGYQHGFSDGKRYLNLAVNMLIWALIFFASLGATYFKLKYISAPLMRSDCQQIGNSHTLRLVDNPRLVNQIAAIERRAARGGKDSIDHPPQGHDDLANVVAGAASCAINRRTDIVEDLRI